MSIQALWTFNENSATSVADFAANGYASTSVSNLTLVDGAGLGIAGLFNGSSTSVNFGVVLDLGGDDKVDIIANIRYDTSQDNPIINKNGGYGLKITAADKVVFSITIGASDITLTSTASITISTYTTIEAVYDGANMYIYIDGTLDTSQAQTGNLDNSAEDMYMGTDTSDYLDGRIDSVEIRNTGLTSDQVTAVNANPIGIKYTFTQAHNLELGDLIVTDQYTDSIKKMVVTYVDSNLILRAKPINGLMNLGSTPIRRGNIIDADRQWLMEAKIDNDEPIIRISDNISNFVDTTAENKEVIRINRVEASREGRDFLRYALMI
ncbi:MAG: hypothetical protein CMB80_00540 [Flammeovirgaceae bacterium]|nr:hypothetical protein [Flammeovirgaceae bacterium]